MKKLILIFVMIYILCFLNQNIFAQVSEGGKPISFSLNINKDDIPLLTMPFVDTKALIIEEAEKEKTQRLYRFGYAIDVDIDIKKSGIKRELSNGDNLWLLKIHSSDAFSIN